MNDSQIANVLGIKNKIKETLGCNFIRFNPNDPNFNIGDVINQIFSEIIHKRDL